MTTRENERRDSGILIILILLLGFICIILASGWAIRFAPSWKLNTNMGSNLDPNSDFLTSRPVGFIEPLDPAILTNPAWINVFLTPGASFETRTPVPGGIPTNIPPQTSTPISTIPATNTSTPVVSPTNTLIFFPPTNTPGPVSSNTPVPPSNTPVSPADLQVTKNDGVTTYSPSGTLTYTITVVNNGPSAVTGAVVTDNLPAQITIWDWACTSQTGGASGCNAVAGSNTNFTDTVNLPNGASIVYTVTANVSAAATGNLTNTASVGVPAGYTDPTPGNNSAVDTDSTLFNTDLQITKTDGSLTYTPGNAITYTIVVSNAGPSNATGASVADTIPAAITGTTINCAASGTASCGTNASAGNNLSFTGVNIPVGAGNSLTITVNGTVNAATTGNLVNTATVTAGAGQTDPNPGNNSATDTDTQFVSLTTDLQITKTDGVAAYVSGGTVTYTITVANNGPSAVIGATVTDTFSTQITNANWTCTPAGGAACAAANGSGNINDLVNMPVGSTITYTVTVNISASAVGTLTNSASVNVPVGVTDTNAGNNTATDSDAPSSTEPDIGVPDGASTNLLPGGSITIVFNPPIIADGDLGTPDFVYYEILASPTTVDLDWVQIEISADGVTWYQVFYWGDGNPETNSNVDISVIGGLEDDNRTFMTTNLYNTTGITIDIDTNAPPGSYSWMRITSPATAANGANIDAIQPYYP